MPEFHSRFGGLWIDDTDTERVIAGLQTIPDLALRRRVASFARDGFVILPGAVAPSVIDAYLAQYDLAAGMAGLLQVEVPMEGGRQAFTRAQSLKHGAKVLDTGMLLPAGQDVCFAPAIAAFLEAVFADRALAFQTLHFEVGSTQAIHQDTAYVVVEAQPLCLVASWVALEDVAEGSGELVYFVGGHRIGEHLYGEGARKHWNVEQDGHAPHDAHLRYLHEEAARRGLEPGRFLPRKGDVLLWHADLPHGGGAVTRPGATRRSLVTHYCPLSCDPYYLRFIPEDWRRKSPAGAGHAFVSMYYPLASLAVAA
jgi:hypothetical protein